MEGGVGAFCKKDMPPQEDERLSRACRSGREAAKFCVDLICCQLREKKVCVLPENSVFCERVIAVLIGNVNKLDGVAESVEKEVTCTRLR